MQTHFEFTVTGYRLRLWVGWTAVFVGLSVAVFGFGLGMMIAAVGLCVTLPTHYAKHRNEVERLQMLSGRWKPPVVGVVSKKEKVLEYRDMFEEGIISFEECHDAVARLYPELDRVLSGGPRQSR